MPEEIYKIKESEYGRMLITRIYTRKSMIFKAYLFGDGNEYEEKDFKVNPINGIAYISNPYFKGEVIHTVDVKKLPPCHDAWCVKHQPEPCFGNSHPKDNL